MEQLPSPLPYPFPCRTCRTGARLGTLNMEQLPLHLACRLSAAITFDLEPADPTLTSMAVEVRGDLRGATGPKCVAPARM